MALELLSQFGLLILVVVIAFAISFVVGMLVVRIVAVPLPPRGGPRGARLQRPDPDPDPETPIERPSAESLAPVTDPAT